MRSGSDGVSVRSLCGRDGGETLQTYALICPTENIFVGTVKTIRRDTWKKMLGIGRVRAGKRRIGRARIQCDERNGWSQWRLMALVGEAIDVSKALTGSFTGRARLRRIGLFGMRREVAADSIATYSGIVLNIGVPY